MIKSNPIKNYIIYKVTIKRNRRGEGANLKLKTVAVPVPFQASK